MKVVGQFDAKSVIRRESNAAKIRQSRKNQELRLQAVTVEMEKLILYAEQQFDVLLSRLGDPELIICSRVVSTNHPPQLVLVVSNKVPPTMGHGYVTVNLKGAHYRSGGNLWQKLFGGSDKVSLSTQITHLSGMNSVSCSSIEEVRQIDVGHPFYFGSGRFIALKLPTDCDGIEMAVTMSAIKSDNLSGALDILNSGELKGTLQMAPPAVSGALAVANVVKKLLTATDPQNSLQGSYAGRLSTAASDNPIRDFCLVQGTIILIYRESNDDTSLDDLDPSKLTTDGDGLKYDGQVVQNTYVMFQVSFDQLKGEDASAQWSGIFSSAEQAIDQLIAVTSDADRQKIWATAYATFQQAVKLLMADPSYTRDEATGLSALHLSSLRKKYAGAGGPPAASLESLELPHAALFLRESLDTDDIEKVANSYLERLLRVNVALPGRITR